MLFNSLAFLFAFLPITCVVFWQLKTKTYRYIWLTITGYVFYSFWNYQFCALMAFSTVVSYAAGLAMLESRTESQRKLCLLVPVVIDLALLGYFKYFNFAIDTVSATANMLHLPVSVPHLSIILPVGISFYTFHTISYMVDSYRRTITPTRNFFEFACYVSLFSQLVAGPIVRFRQIEQDLENIDHVERSRFWNTGWSFFAIGMIEKVVIADTIAAIIDPALAGYASLSTLDTWLCVLGYTYQLYFDFAGYSNMAVGLGYMFAIHIPQNFNSPYKAVDISDFWRRWHISLSMCLRDYVYIPLGGNRGPAWHVYRNMFLTMLIGGLWHGANWTFVFWGAYHGVLLILHRAFSSRWQALPTRMRQLLTFFLVLIGWVFFRCPTFEMATTLISKMFACQIGPLIPGVVTLVFMLAIAAYLAHKAPNTFELEHKWSFLPGILLTILFALAVCLIYARKSSPFLYFQF